MSREIFEDKAQSRYLEMLADFKNLAINRFEWNNLPFGLTSEKLEEMLIEKGQLMFFKKDKEGYYILPCMGTTNLNVYGLPIEYQVFSVNGTINKTISIDEGVLIKNNPLGSDNISTLEIFAKRIDDVEMTQEVNLFQQCVPKIILADENSLLTVKNLMNKVRDFKFYIFGKKTLKSNISTTDVLDTSSPFLLDKLQLHKNELRNEVLTYLGINNSNIQKKERMIVDEVNSNNDYIQISLDLMYDLRKKACEEINQKYGLNMQVKKREVEQVEYQDNDNSRNDRE